MATATRSEYISIDGVPLTTAAWETEDASAILNGPGTRGSDLRVPTRAGSIARRRTLEPREISIPIVVNGWYDSDGGTHADPRIGLVENLDELKQHLSPQYTTLAGTRTLLWLNDNGVYREAEVHVSPAINVQAVGPYAARVVVNATIPGGVLRGGKSYASTTVGAGNTSSTTYITVQGTGEIQDIVLIADGDATWPGPVTPVQGAGAPPPGSFATGDFYYDTTNDEWYGPREAGGAWPGPIEINYSGSAPGADRVYGADFVYVFSADEMYGPRTTANPNCVDLRITNLSYDSAGGVYVERIGALNNRLEIRTGNYYATLGSSNVSGSIVHAGVPLWLPVIPGNNDLELNLTTNTSGINIGFEYRSVWL